MSHKRYQPSGLPADEAGLSLIETIAALGVAVLVIGALVSLAVASLRSSGSAKTAAIAGTLADKELETVRVYRDNANWDAFILGVGICTNADLGACGAASCYMLDNPVNGKAIGTNMVTRGGIGFTRCFNYEDASALGDDTKVRIVAIITWTDWVGDHITRAETYLAEWE